jgi:tyrosyl-tRNA synthetase
LIQQGGAYVNEERVDSIEAAVDIDDLVDGQILLRAGKKRYHRLEIGPDGRA